MRINHINLIETPAVDTHGRLGRRRAMSGGVAFVTTSFLGGCALSVDSAELGEGGNGVVASSSFALFRAVTMRMTAARTVPSVQVAWIGSNSYSIAGEPLNAETGGLLPGEDFFLAAPPMPSGPTDMVATLKFRAGRERAWESLFNAGIRVALPMKVARVLLPVNLIIALAR